MNLAIDHERLQSEIEELARISDADPPAVTRIVLLAEGPSGPRLAADQVRSGGPSASGKTRSAIRSPAGSASEDAAPAVATGSHVDAIPNAGKYDGVVGVLGGLEAIRALKAAGFARGARSS